MSETTFPHRSAADGLELLVRGWIPKEPRALVHVLHGMAEHSRRYGRLAALLAEHRFAVYAHDHRGHGDSVSKALPLGHMADRDAWQRTVDDARDVADAVAALHPGLPRIVLGHSMGSFAVQQLLWQEPGKFRAAALSGTNGRPTGIDGLGWLVARLERRVRGRATPSRWIQSLAFGGFNRPFEPARTEFDWLSRDPIEVDRYIQDPTCGFPMSTQTWVDLLTAVPGLTAEKNLRRIPKDLPIYLFSGDRDPVGKNGTGVSRLRDAYVGAGLRHVPPPRLYPGARHETLNETNRDEVMNDLLAFLESAIR